MKENENVAVVCTSRRSDVLRGGLLMWLVLIDVFASLKENVDGVSSDTIIESGEPKLHLGGPTPKYCSDGSVPCL